MYPERNKAFISEGCPKQADSDQNAVIQDGSNYGRNCCGKRGNGDDSQKEFGKKGSSSAPSSSIRTSTLQGSLRKATAEGGAGGDGEDNRHNRKETPAHYNEAGDEGESDEDAAEGATGKNEECLSSSYGVTLTRTFPSDHRGIHGTDRASSNGRKSGEERVIRQLPIAGGDAPRPPNMPVEDREEAISSVEGHIDQDIPDVATGRRGMSSETREEDVPGEEESGERSGNTNPAVGENNGNSTCPGENSERRIQKEFEMVSRDQDHRDTTSQTRGGAAGSSAGASAYEDQWQKAIHNQIGGTVPEHDASSGPAYRQNASPSARGSINGAEEGAVGPTATAPETPIINKEIRRTIPPKTPPPEMESPRISILPAPGNSSKDELTVATAGCMVPGAEPRSVPTWPPQEAEAESTGPNYPFDSPSEEQSPPASTVQPNLNGHILQPNPEEGEGDEDLNSTAPAGQDRSHLPPPTDRRPLSKRDARPRDNTDGHHWPVPITEEASRPVTLPQPVQVTNDDAPSEFVNGLMTVRPPSGTTFQRTSSFRITPNLNVSGSNPAVTRSRNRVEHESGGNVHGGGYTGFEPRERCVQCRDPIATDHICPFIDHEIVRATGEERSGGRAFVGPGLDVP